MSLLEFILSVHWPGAVSICVIALSLAGVIGIFLTGRWPWDIGQYDEADADEADDGANDQTKWHK